MTFLILSGVRVIFVVRGIMLLLLLSSIDQNTPAISSASSFVASAAVTSLSISHNPLVELSIVLLGVHRYPSQHLGLC